jgi:triacylglycerol esterase/lipase EstA (alpha/beta hydrolase family)
MMPTTPTSLPLEPDVAAALQDLATASEHGLNAVLRDVLKHSVHPQLLTTADGPLPVPYSFAAGLLADLLHPGSNPPGSNNWDRRPAANHPLPVVLVHGLFGNMTNSWQALSPLLTNHGYTVFALTYGLTEGTRFGGRAPVETSAQELGVFVDRVLAATGAPQVDIVGHSLGGLMPRYYLKALGGAAKVHTLVGLAPVNHGTTLDGIVSLAGKLGINARGVPIPDCQSCDELVVGSRFLTALNAGGDVVGGVEYTVIATRFDELVTPYESAFLQGPGVNNITLQDHCDHDFSEHLAVIYDPIALHFVLGALDRAPAKPVPCVFVPPFLG